ncbi:MAG: replicative DNA helicase [Ruminococcaceae bacterium]|nr:replicative DNA helicase [Oscillospiraceae bacterium]
MADTNVGDYELPHSLEAEKAVIGCIMQDNKALAASAEIVKADDFYFDANREIYAISMELFNENTPVDVVTVSDRLTRYDKLDAVGGVAYLTSLMMSITTTENVVYYAKIIREKSVLRRLSKTATAINSIAVAQDTETETVLERATQMIIDVVSEQGKGEIVPVSDIIMEAYQEMVENSSNPNKLTGVPTGFDELNRRCGGFHGGEFILIAGRPGMGKSSFAVNIAEHVAISEGKTVAVFNLEMPKEAVLKRILCSQAYIDSSKLITGKMEGEDWARLGKVLDKIASAPLYIDDSSVVTVSEIRAKCQRLKQTRGLAMVVIDYLQLMQGSGRNESRQQEISDISRSLKIMAKELGVPVVALSQLSRASESRQDKRPMLSDIRESGAIEQDADMVIFLYRDEYYNKETEDKGLAEVILAKHRAGETGMFKLGWKGQYTKFINIDYHKEEE